METLVSNREGRSRGKLPLARGFVKVNPAEISSRGEGLLVCVGLGRGLGLFLGRLSGAGVGGLFVDGHG